MEAVRFPWRYLKTSHYRSEKDKKLWIPDYKRRE